MRKILFYLILFSTLHSTVLSNELNTIISNTSSSYIQNVNACLDKNVLYLTNYYTNGDSENDPDKVLVQKYDLILRKIVWENKIDAGSHDLIPYLSIVDSFGNLEIYSNYISFSSYEIIMDSKPQKNTFNSEGLELEKKLDTNKTISNIQSQLRFIKFSNSISFIYNTDGLTNKNKTVFCVMDSSFTLDKSRNLDTIPTIAADTSIYYYKAIEASGSSQNYAYYGGLINVGHLEAGKYYQDDSVNIYIAKIDSIGNTIWMYRTYGNTAAYPKKFKNIITHSDGSVSVYYVDKIENVARIIHLSSNGEFINDFKICGAGEKSAVAGYFVNKQNEYIVYGNKTLSNGVIYHWITKFLQNGDKVYDYIFAQASKYDLIANILQKDDYSYIVISDSFDPDEHLSTISIMEFSDAPSGINESTVSTSAYWNGYSITVTGANNEEIELAELYDITGRLVASQNGLSSGVFVPNTEIEPGAYILQLSSPKGKTAVKVMVR